MVFPIIILYLYINFYIIYNYIIPRPIFLCSGFAHADNLITNLCSKKLHGCSYFWNLDQYVQEPSGTFLRNIYQHIPEPSGICRTFRNPSELASGTYTSTHRNLPELSGTLRNLRNLFPEPAPATRTGTHRSLSGLKTPLAYVIGEQ